MHFCLAQHELVKRASDQRQHRGNRQIGQSGFPARDDCWGRGLVGNKGLVLRPDIFAAAYFVYEMQALGDKFPVQPVMELCHLHERCIGAVQMQRHACARGGVAAVAWVLPSMLPSAGAP